MNCSPLNKKRKYEKFIYNIKKREHIFDKFNWTNFFQRKHLEYLFRSLNSEEAKRRCNELSWISLLKKIRKIVKLSKLTNPFGWSYVCKNMKAMSILKKYRCDKIVKTRRIKVERKPIKKSKIEHDRRYTE